MLVLVVFTVLVFGKIVMMQHQLKRKYPGGNIYLEHQRDCQILHLIISSSLLSVLVVVVYFYSAM